jgi:ubiquinone/menaquinone biosynthesis C-methylase UbiE
MSHSWEREYTNPTFISKDPKPKEDFLKFVNWLRKKEKISLEGLCGLDLGCGTGRHSLYLAEHFNMKMYAIDFSKTAISIANKKFQHESVVYHVGSIGDIFPVANDSINIVLDIMSSFALSSKERLVYLGELARTIKKGGYLYLRTLAREGDDNAKFLIKNNPGPDENSYIHPTLGSPETVFSKGGVERLYGSYFEIKHISKKTGYQKFSGQSYKRQYWNVYLQKK